MNPNDFFMANGGGEFLAALGVAPERGLLGLFGTTYPSWKPGKVSSPMVMQTHATLLVTSDGIELHSLAAAPDKLPKRVLMSKPLKTNELVQLAIDALKLPRPALLLTVGPSYGKDVSRARLTFDATSIEVSGKTNLVIEGYRVDLIRRTSATLGIPLQDLRTLAVHLERSLVDPRLPLTGPRAVKAMTKALGGAKTIKALGKDELADRIDALWEAASSLPPSSDASWRAAEQKEGN